MIKTTVNARRIIYIVLPIFCVFFLVAINTVQLPANNQWKDFKAILHKKEVILDGVQDGNMAYLITSSTGNVEYGDTFVACEFRTGEWIRIYQNDFMNLKPWKIEAADIDGDGIKEILTAVSKTTHFDKTEKNRMFIFNFLNGMLVKKWTGSQIAGTWVDFTAGDLVPIKGSEIAFVRKTEEGERISVYYWFDFGFLLLAESEDFDKIVSITIPKENMIHIVYKENGKEKKATLSMKDNRLIEE